MSRSLYFSLSQCFFKVEDHYFSYDAQRRESEFPLYQGQHIQSPATPTNIKSSYQLSYAAFFAVPFTLSVTNHGNDQNSTQKKKKNRAPAFDRRKRMRRRRLGLRSTRIFPHLYNHSMTSNPLPSLLKLSISVPTH